MRDSSWMSRNEGHADMDTLFQITDAFTSLTDFCVVTPFIVRFDSCLETDISRERSTCNRVRTDFVLESLLFAKEGDENATKQRL